MSSFMKTIDNKMNNIVEGVKQNELVITHIQSQIFESFEKLEPSLTTVSLLLSKQIEKSRKLESRFNELIQCVFELVEGKLLPHLIPPNTLSECINDIQDILRNKFQEFYLILTNPNDIYKNVNTFYTRNNTKL